jgi:hypothetical protein
VDLLAEGGVPVQRGTVHKHRNLLAYAPERLHEEITADYNDMIYAATRTEVEARRKAFIRKWRLKHRAIADSVEEAGRRPSPSLDCQRANGSARASPTGNREPFDRSFQARSNRTRATTATIDPAPIMVPLPAKQLAFSFNSTRTR